MIKFSSYFELYNNGNRCSKSVNLMFLCLLFKVCLICIFESKL